MAIQLSESTAARLELLFSGDDLHEARTLLERDCAENIDGSERPSPEGYERIRFAVMKLSAGTIGGLVDAITLAQTDWRDALVSAGFGDDVDLHESWWPGQD